MNSFASENLLFKIIARIYVDENDFLHKIQTIYYNILLNNWPLM